MSQNKRRQRKPNKKRPIRSTKPKKIVEKPTIVREVIPGNTKEGITSSNYETRARAYCFTINNYTENELIDIEKDFIGKSWKYIIGKEIGTSGTPHLQGYIKSNNAIRFSTLKKMMSKAHIEVAKGDIKQNVKYCCKDNDYISNIDKKFFPKIDAFTIGRQMCMKRYENVVWKTWQKELLEKLEKEPEERIINWFWEPLGGVGKSFLCKYIGLTKNAIMATGKTIDIFNAIRSKMMEGKLPEIIILDIPKSNKEFVNYGTLEMLKNGYIYSGKYEGGDCFFPTPHIIVFANQKPKYKKMTSKRFNTVYIGEENDIIIEKEDLIIDLEKN